VVLLLGILVFNEMLIIPFMMPVESNEIVEREEGTFIGTTTVP
jgi:hypothetical protein